MIQLTAHGNPVREPCHIHAFPGQQVGHIMRRCLTIHGRVQRQDHLANTPRLDPRHKAGNAKVLRPDPVNG